MRLLLVLIMLTQVPCAVGKNYLDENLKRLDWNGIEVVWIEDDSLPTFDVIFYFDEGALADPKNKNGTTELVFSELTAGTQNFTRQQIVESLEYFGVSYGSRVTHEFSSFAVSGLVKNFNPSMKLVCQMFSQATFPANELKKTKRRILSGMKNMISNHSSLADQVFRAESLKNSGYEIPTIGLMRTLAKISAKDLASRLVSLNKKAFKKIYLRGGKELSQLRNIISNDCGWQQHRTGPTKKPDANSTVKTDEVILVPVPGANQAQVRIGRLMTSLEVEQGLPELKTFAAKYLGGGFTSRLVQGLRIGKGYTYSAGAYASEQKMYGRVGIMTSTANKTLVPLLMETKKIIQQNSNRIDQQVFERAVKNAQGNYLLGLESTSDFLKNLIYFDHVGRKYAEIYKYSDVINDVTSKDLTRMIDKLFKWDDQLILILGDPSLEEKLKKAGFKVRKVKYQNYI